MIKKLLVFVLIAFPFVINAAENDSNNLELLDQVTKYYKIIVYYNNDSLFNNSITTEISEEEYENSNDLLSKDATVETTYKKLTSSIYQNGNYYRYKAKLVWKSIPSVRSYDIIGIGFYQSVKVKNNNTFFTQEYCISGGSCYTSSINYPQVFNSGAGTSFQLPSGSLNSLNQTFYFDVEKNTSSTITTQLAASDYSHATSSISLNNSKKYTVNTNGIALNGVSSYYDSMNAAKAYWSGSW